MTTREQKRLLLENMTVQLELPESAYERAKDRYDDIGKWLGRDESLCRGNDPHIFPQGSFRLGTAIRPLNEAETYDLDLACNLQAGITKTSHTQESLKKLVGHEIETYRVAKGIKAAKEEKHRCWRLEYQDDLSFHMDIVPCIPEDKSRQKSISESMRKFGEDESIAESASSLSVSITDDRHPGYKRICNDWNISNPEGYAKWFEARMNQSLRMFVEKAQIDDMPLFKRKMPLQRSIQLLKRHRDKMFKEDKDVKPISIIITTLAARAYKGEPDIESALSNILMHMVNFVNSGSSSVPNPVNPEENFADRWTMPQYRHLQLRENFKKWVIQVQIDFDLLGSTDDVSFITEQAEQKFSVKMNTGDLVKHLGLTQATISIVTPKAHVISAPAKPHWGMEP
ncbi:MAG: nucleotidyltransferase [Proteobacteria bacterium]|nr:nucleotidyltransferase [Pseudomonadota bacterium]